MPDDTGHRYADRVAGPLVAALAALVHELVRREAADEVRRLVREELDAGTGSEAEWMTQAAAARLAGVAAQTIRSWQADGKLAKGRRGRVNAAELRRFLSQGTSPPEAEQFASAPELRQERARRAAQELLGKLRQRGGGET